MKIELIHSDLFHAEEHFDTENEVLLFVSGYPDHAHFEIHKRDSRPVSIDLFLERAQALRDYLIKYYPLGYDDAAPTESASLREQGLLMLHQELETAEYELRKDPDSWAWRRFITRLRGATVDEKGRLTLGPLAPDHRE